MIAAEDAWMDQVRSWCTADYRGFGHGEQSLPFEPSSDLLAMTVAMGILRNGRTGGVLTQLLRQRRWWGSQGSSLAFS